MKRIQRVDLINGPILPALLSFAFSYSFIQYLPTTLQYLRCHDCRAFFRSKNLWPPLGQPLLFLIWLWICCRCWKWDGIIIAWEIMGLKTKDQLRKSVAATAIIGCILSLFVIFIGRCRTISPAPVFRDPISHCVSVLSLYRYHC